MIMSELNDLIHAALTGRKLIPVSTIHNYAGVAAPKVYQVPANYRDQK